MIKPNSIIGIIGGGQLGRMSALAAANLGFKTHIYTPEQSSPASAVSYKTTIGAYDDKQKLHEFAQSVDVITFEFENIPHSSIRDIETNGSTPIHPNSNLLQIAQNRIKEKDFLSSANIATPKYTKINSTNDLTQAIFSEPFKSTPTRKAILKTTEFGYDGKGQKIINLDDYQPNSCEQSLSKIWADFNVPELILEEFIPFSKEVSLIIARNKVTRDKVTRDKVTHNKIICDNITNNESQTSLFPIAENIHKNGILDTSTIPANISLNTQKEIHQIGNLIADKLQLIGVLAIEFFITQNNTILVNEIAPRPHNSGHYSMDFCITSQFEQFIRSICGWNLGSTNLKCNGVMHNLIGNDINNWQEIIAQPNSKLHLYGKTDARDGRKMGHVNIIKPL